MGPFIPDTSQPCHHQVFTSKDMFPLVLVTLAVYLGVRVSVLVLYGLMKDEKKLEEGRILSDAESSEG